MKKVINNILVPVDFGKQSDVAIEKAVQLANHFHCGLHILHVENASFIPLAVEGNFFTNGKGNDKADAADKLSLLENRYAPMVNKGLPFQVCIEKGNTEQMIVEYAVRNHIDFIVIGKSNKTKLGDFFHRLNINRIARKTNSAVLTVKPNPALDSIRNIVLPVDAHLPVRKIMFAGYLAKIFGSKIHLIALTRQFPVPRVEDTVYLYKTYQLLKTNTNLSVECHTVPGENIAETTLEYAQQINADLIVVNPGKELLLSGFLNRLFARFITSESGIPVMTIAPSH